jgi:CRISPR-associated protein Cas1
MPDRPTNLQVLPRFADSLSFLYVERARIDRHELAVAAWDDEGMIPIPCAALAALVLGPGTTVTQAAMRTLADHGCTVVWAGEEGVRFYASGAGETRRTNLLEAQAKAWADPRFRLRVARLLYAMRFPGQDVSKLSLTQLRGREGARVRAAYAAASSQTGIPWKKRNYDRSDWYGADPVNRALSAANACLYGVCHAGIVSLGCSPGLGFIHTGKTLSFVYDLADLYKAETTIPAAFRAVASGQSHLEQAARHACRDTFVRTRLLERIAQDLHYLFGTGDREMNPSTDEEQAAPGSLWDPNSRDVQGGHNYAETP